jgi:hypothetical protein
MANFNRRFSNSKKIQYGERTYDSNLEAKYAKVLDLQIKQNMISDYIPQYKIDITVNGKHICNYFVDFKVIRNDGEFEFHEVKGYETEIWRMKWKLSKALYPNTKFELIKKIK